MSEREPPRPPRKEIRASLVDSGWTSAPPPPAREDEPSPFDEPPRSSGRRGLPPLPEPVESPLDGVLPELSSAPFPPLSQPDIELPRNYEENDGDVISSIPPDRPLPAYDEVAPREPIVTQVDDQIQSRLKAMREVGSDPVPRKPSVPPPPPSSRVTPPQNPPPASATSTPIAKHTGRSATVLFGPRLPVPPGAPAPPEPVSEQVTTRMPAPEMAAAQAAAAQSSARPPPPAPFAPPAAAAPNPFEAPPAPAPPPVAPAPAPAPFAANPFDAPPAPAPAAPAAGALDLTVPAAPFATAPAVGASPSLGLPASDGALDETTAPPLLSAMVQRVRFAGGEVPLWALLSPAVLLIALAAAFIGAAVAGPSSTTAEAGAEPAASGSAVSSLPLLPAPVDDPKKLGRLERAALGDEAILKELEAKPDTELTFEEAVALAQGLGARELRRARELRAELDRDPGLVKDPKVLVELRKFVDNPQTAPEVLAAMARLPGPIGADMLYEVWTGTVARTAATELARTLVLGKDVQAKASPALKAALDLRAAETCEAAKSVLSQATEHGDKRSLHLLTKLNRRFGCGPNKRQDCYPCLREGDELERALKAVRNRREPKPFGR